MSKKKAHGERKQSQPVRKGRGNLKVMIVAAVVLGLGLTGVILAQFRAARVASTTNTMLAAPVAPAPATFSPSSPSKEYIYAGGRLVATEEPSGGTTTEPPTTEPPTTDPGPNATPTPTPVPPASIPAGGKHSLLLNGTNAYAQFNHSTALDITGALTVEAWVKYTPNTKYQEIVAKENYGSTGGGYALQITPTGKLRFILYQAGNAFVTVVGATTIGAGEWHHVAGVFDGTSERRVYLDGVEDGNASSAGSAPASCTGGLKIGRLSSSATLFFNGLIDEVRVSNRALYSGDFNPETSPGNDASTAGVWKFDAQNLDEYPVNNNPGTPQGTVAYSPDVPAATNYSLYLNGTNAYAEVNYSASLDLTGPLTLEAWVNYTPNGKYQEIVAKENYGTTGGGYALQITSAGKLRFILYQAGNSYIEVVSTNPITAGTWVHVAGAYDSSGMRVYIGGKFDKEVPGTAPMSCLGGLKIGRLSSGNSLYFKGLIDEVRVSAGALYTSTEPTEQFKPETNLSATSGVTRGLWKFNAQTADDSSGQNNHGTIKGGAIFSTDVKMAGEYSLWLNGLDAYARIPYNAAINDNLDITGALTVEAWVYYTPNTKYQEIVAKECYGTTNCGGYALQITSADKVRFVLYQGGTSFVTVVGNTTLEAGQWYHVAGVFDGTSERRVYVNGKWDGTASSAGSAPASGSSNLHIGRLCSSNTLFFNGMIDEVRVSAGELYTGTSTTQQSFTPAKDLTPTANVTRGLWTFDRQTVRDSSGKGNNGTPQGAATYSIHNPKE